MRRIISLVPILAAVAAGQTPTPGRGVNFYSIPREIALGKQLAAEFQRDSAPLDSPVAQAYLNDLGQRLAAQSPTSVFTYSFTLTADDPAALHESPAFPGGFIFVPARLILAAKDEDELAGMLAHSIAHIAARHGTKSLTREELVEKSVTPLIFMGGWTGYATQQGAGLAIPMGMLTFQRAFEREADHWAVQITSAAGYDPAGLAHYIEREQPPYDAATSKAWSPLPTFTARVAAIDAAGAALPARTYDSHPGFEAMKAEVLRLTESKKAPPTLGK